MGLTYATREQVKAAANFNGSDEDAAVDRLLESGSRGIEKLLLRHFYPLIETRVYDYPVRNSGPFCLWLNADLLAVESLTTAGVAIADYFLAPANFGPPYNRIELDIAAGAVFMSGDSWQRQIAVEGTWGYSQDEDPAGALAEALDASETDVDVTDSSKVGIGDLLHIESERMVVTGKALLSTGTTISADLDDNEATVTIPVASAAAVKLGEVITVDAERMRVIDIAGNNLIVKRALDASVLASHTSGATVYAPRTLTVERGAVGTSAAAHNTAMPITRNLPPGPITELVIAEVIAAREQEKSGYGRNIGQGEGATELRGVGLRNLRLHIEDEYRRRRTGAI